MRSLCPMITPGIPEKLYPATSNGQSTVIDWQRNPTWYQTEGSAGPRCGSLASRGLPVSVRAPATTQELEPISPPAGPSNSGTDPRCERNSVRARAYESTEPGASGPVLGVAPRSAAGTSVESTFGRAASAPGDGLVTAWLPVMVGCCSDGKSGCSWRTSAGVSVVDSRARSISSSRLERRSQAMAFSHATESAGVHGSTSYPGFWRPKTAYSSDRSAPSWVPR